MQTLMGEQNITAIVASFLSGFDQRRQLPQSFPMAPTHSTHRVAVSLRGLEE